MGRWAKYLSLKEDQLSAFQKDVSDFRHVAPCRNQSTSETTGIEYRGKISHFLTPPVKFSNKRWVKCLSEFYVMSSA